jgi:hypothetical protein
MDRNVWVYDIETLLSCFTYSALNIDTDEIVQYVIHESKNELTELYSHLMSIKGQIGYNNIGFDYPVLHYILKNIDTLRNMSTEQCVRMIYSEAQRVIKAGDDKFNRWGAIIPEWKTIIPQLDLYKIWHYDNPNRRTSLKSLAVSMNFPNVQEMPIHHSKPNITVEELEGILDYNKNDILVTFDFYKKSIEKINLRKDLIKTYGINCINYPDPKIGENLVLELYCDRIHSPIKEIRKLRSKRSEIALNECLLPDISFNTKEFKNLLDKFKTTVIKNTKGEFGKSVIFRGLKYEFGTGGVHACNKAGIYQSDIQYVIIDADVMSLYPSIAILNKFYPEHLGLAFCEVYEQILKERIAAKKAGKMTISDALKLALNGTYGKFNDKYSFLYDPKTAMSVTVNGQLMLAMLCEDFICNLKDSVILQTNTDGITIRIPRTELENYYNLCKQWENKTRLTLEYVEYSKMWIADVNSYGAISTTGKIKNKGRFEVDKVVGNEPAYHKDNSFRIIPLALQEFFTKGTSVEETIKNHTDIYDFCGRQKFKGEDYGYITKIEGDKIVEEKQQKVTRYYISNRGHVFIKHYAKGSEEIIHRDYLVTIFNKFIEKDIDKYNIDYSFYIRECYKEINQILDKQQSIMFPE